MNSFANFCLLLGWLLALTGCLSGCTAAISRSERWFHTARNATILCGVVSMLSVAGLGALFLQDDYRNQYVWQFSNQSMDWIYKVSAIWGGMDGSMLLWAGILAVSTAILAWQSVHPRRQLMSWVLAVANSSTLFFLTVVAFFTNPFRAIKAPFIPPDGNGLNPLLQNPYMAVHPPLLYLGFTTFAIPFAFCVGALLAGDRSPEWIRLARRWTLIAWIFLTSGIVMGGHWAYLELGWGGFWAWDPVENSSFLPWLTGTAFLHSVMVQERKGMLKMWNLWLVVATYALTVFGTFLTRSGIVQSVHAFASTDIGWVFLLYLSIIVVFTLVVSIRSRHILRPERKIESFLSREAAFLLNNLLLLSICFATFWGVMFPVFSEAITEKKQTVGIPFFNAVNGPLFIVLLLAMGIGPLVSWRKTTWATLRRMFTIPALFGCLSGAALLFGGIEEPKAVTVYAVCAFIVAALVMELHRGVKAHRSGSELGYVGAAGAHVRKHYVRYGGHLVHLGVVVVAIAVSASLIHKTEREFALRSGESIEVGRYRLSLASVREGREANYEYLEAEVSVMGRSGEESLGVLRPQLRFYPRNRETTTEVALRMGLRDDLYLVLAGLDEQGTLASFKVYINPLQVWLWFGAMIMTVGTVVVLLPQRDRVAARAALGVRSEAISS
ncbi:MAG: heme lyase CcmF/NrfE family subunit [Bdellovibrionota bacterium]|nr:MAG: heme lyase CcmF/NrfE family subunit [Bdellovibrionota bacterium]